MLIEKACIETRVSDRGYVFFLDAPGKGYKQVVKVSTGLAVGTASQR